MGAGGGGRFGGADGVVADFPATDDGFTEVFPSDVTCAFDTPMRITGAVFFTAGFPATGFAVFAGIRTAGFCERLTTALLIGVFLAGVRVVADFAVVRVAAVRLAAGFFATLFATRPTALPGAFLTAFFTAGRDATVRVATTFFTTFFADFAGVFFVAFFAATLRDAAFFIALPLRIQGDGAAHALDAMS